MGRSFFLQHVVSKLHPEIKGEGRGGIVMNGSPLFNGNAESGPSNIRKWLFEHDLVVLPRELVNALRGGEAFDAGVGSGMIVGVEPSLVGGFAFSFASVGARVGPFGCEGPIEAFALPVRLGTVRPGVPVFDCACERLVEHERPVARAVIGHHRGDRHTQAVKEHVGAGPESRCALIAFVVKDL